MLYCASNLGEIPDLSNDIMRNGYHALQSDIPEVTRKPSILQRSKQSALRFSKWLFKGIIYTFQDRYSNEFSLF